MEPSGETRREKTYQLVGYVCSVSFSSTTSLALRLVRPRNSVKANMCETVPFNYVLWVLCAYIPGI